MRIIWHELGIMINIIHYKLVEKMLISLVKKRGRKKSYDENKEWIKNS